MKRLHDLEPAEVSLVDKGANKKKFLILKNDSSTIAEPEDKRMAKDLKQASAEQSPEKINKEHHEEALKVAKAAYSSHIAKLGGRMYPDAVMTQKAADDKEKEDVEKAKKEEMEKADKEKMEKAEKEKMEKAAIVKAESEKVSKQSVEKGTEMEKLDLSSVPKEVRPAVEAIYKSNQELVAKAEQIQKELVIERNLRRKGEFVAKAAVYKNLGISTDDLASTLMTIADASPEAVEKIEKMLATADAQVAKGDLFKEIGSSRASKVGPTWEAIEKAAEGAVAKSGVSISKAEAVTKFLETPEGSAMYTAYMSEHPSNGGK